MLNTKDEILGGGSATANVQPPIDSSLEGAPSAQKNPATPATGQGQQAPATTAQAGGNGASDGTADNAAKSSSSEATTTGNAAQDNSGNSGGDGQGNGGKRMSYVEMFQKLNPYQPPTQEEIEKEKKKRKREQIFNAISDGIQALSNLYFTTQYAPNSYNPKNSLSAKAQERWDKLDKERQANNDAYYKGWIQAAAADDAAARDNRNWLHTIEREKIEDKRYDANIEHRDAREAVEDKRYDDQWQHKKDREAVEDERCGKQFGLQKKQFNENVREFNVTRADRRNAAANGGKGGKNQYTLTINGKILHYSSKEDYERAVQRYAKQYGVKTHQNVTTSERSTMPNQTKQKTVATPKPISQLAGEVEERANPSDNTPPSRRGNNSDNTPPSRRK